MRTIRQNTFETNSSSTHSVAIVTEEEYENLINGKYYLRTTYDFDVINHQERNDIIYERMVQEDWEFPTGIYDLDDEISKFLEDYDERYDLPCNYEDYIDDSSVETCYYTTQSGDKIIAVSIYGYD